MSVEPVMVTNRQPDAKELAMAASKGLHWDPWKQAYFDTPATNPICGQEGCPVQVPHGHTSVPDWRSYACPDIDQGADDSHMVFPEEEPLPTQYGPAKTSMVNNPPHYQAGGMDAITVIEAFAPNYHRGNALKYLLRAGKKGELAEDLRKAIWYIERELRFIGERP